MKKASIMFYPNTKKKNLKSSKVPIYMRVTFDARKSEAKLNCEVLEDQLPKWNTSTMRLDLKGNGINHFLSNIEQKFERLKMLNDYNLDAYSADTIKSYLLGESTRQRPTIVDYVRAYYLKAVEQNSQFVEGTKRNYNKSINHLLKFIELTKRDKLYLKDLNTEIAFEFKDYLVKDFPDRKGMTEVSAASIFKNLKLIFNRAVHERHLESNPFKSVKLKHRSPRRDRHTIHQIKKTCQLELNPLSVPNLYRDYFLFSVFTGLTYKDLVGHY